MTLKKTLVREHDANVTDAELHVAQYTVRRTAAGARCLVNALWFKDAAALAANVPLAGTAVVNTELDVDEGQPIIAQILSHLESESEKPGNQLEGAVKVAEEVAP